MTEHTVVIAGGGPTGLMLAGELALAGVDLAIVEWRANQDLPPSGQLPETIKTPEGTAESVASNSDAST